MTRAKLTEAQVRQIVKEELFYHSIVSEGIWDDVRTGTQRMVKAVTTKVAGSGLMNKAKEALASVTKLPDSVNVIIQALKLGMKETGESIQLDDTLKAARELGQLTTEKMGAMLAADLKGPVHAKAAKLQNETWNKQVTDVLQEISLGIDKHHKLIESPERLDEAGPLGIVGLSLAGFGALLFLMKGLEKLAHLLGAEKTAAAIHKAHHVLHHIEGKAIDYVVPDRLSYIVYKILRKKGFKLVSNKKKRSLTYEEYKENDKARAKVEKLIYSAFLLFLAFNGIKAALHAGISLLGFAEGGATVIKGVEIGQAAGHLSDIIELGIEEA